MDFLKTGEYKIKHNLPTGNTAVYGRVSASKQKKDLQTQISALCMQANSEGFTPKINRDIGSGLNDKHPRFLRLLIDVIHGKFDRLYITYRDRFTRFGTHSFEEIFHTLHIDIICIREEIENPLETRLVNDVIALITSFAGKLHRSRRGKIAKI